MTWWQLEDGNYVNACALVGLGAVQTTVPDWAIGVRSDQLPSGSSNPFLVGRYASKADAQEAIRKLCQGIDPSTITGV